MTMAKHRKPSIADGISFAFELYKRIPVRRKITASELQAQLEEINLGRDIRTIQRNLDVLVRYFDVEKDTRDKPYGYSRKSSNKRTIGAREAIILSLAQEQLRQVLPKELMSAVESTFTEAMIQYAPLNDETDLLTPTKVHIQATSTTLLQGIQRSVFENLCIALYHNRRLSLTLEPASGVKLDILDAMPLGLLACNNTLYMVYQGKSQTEVQNVPLSQIQKLHVSTYGFTYPSYFDLKQYSIREPAGLNNNHTYLNNVPESTIKLR